MTEQPRHTQNLRSAAEQDLLSTLWQAEANYPANYPWTLTAELESTYFLALEAEADLDEWEPSATQSQQFYNSLDQLWLTTAQAETAAVTASRSLLAHLSDRFADKIPHDLLATIAQRAQQALHNFLEPDLVSAQTHLDQLVYCVQSILPTWGDDDLQVLARPLVAMRSLSHSSVSNPLMEKVRPVTWQALSDIEKARLSLTIADYALSTLTVTTVTDESEDQ